MDWGAKLPSDDHGHISRPVYGQNRMKIFSKTKNRLKLCIEDLGHRIYCKQFRMVTSGVLFTYLSVGQEPVIFGRDQRISVAGPPDQLIFMFSANRYNLNQQKCRDDLLNHMHAGPADQLGLDLRINPVTLGGPSIFFD